ncbi:chemotaxis protein CheW [Algiphilus sp.]|uniref:chemotaxis protein CheW n=1 Tax=Algiphilus sp. TaxID=1872431 RepID=UPI002A60D8E6|nr:chemotaxis protein CheW [Pseudomonadota bacterium]
MNAQAESGGTPQSIFAVLLTQENGDHLLLPNVAVLEVGNIYHAPAGAEPARWLRGTVDHDGIAVPALDLEQLNAGGSSEARRARPVFVQTYGRLLQHPVIALLCRGHPHLVDVEPTALTPEPLGSRDRDDLVLSRVRLGNTVAMIPDLHTIEAELARAGVAAR